MNAQIEISCKQQLKKDSGKDLKILFSSGIVALGYLFFAISKHFEMHFDIKKREKKNIFQKKSFAFSIIL